MIFILIPVKTYGSDLIWYTFQAHFLRPEPAVCRARQKVHNIERVFISNIPGFYISAMICWWNISFLIGTTYSWFGTFLSCLGNIQAGPTKGGVQGVHRTRARALGGRKSSGYRVMFWCRSQWYIHGVSMGLNLSEDLFFLLFTQIWTENRIKFQ